MKKKIKLVTERKRINWLGMFFLLWCITLVGYLGTSIFLHSYNTKLTTNILENDQQIATLQESVNTLSLTVKELSTRERVVNMVSSQGLKSNADNVVSVQR